MKDLMGIDLVNVMRRNDTYNKYLQCYYIFCTAPQFIFQVKQGINQQDEQRQ